MTKAPTLASAPRGSSQNRKSLSARRSEMAKKSRFASSSLSAASCRPRPCRRRARRIVRRAMARSPAGSGTRAIGTSGPIRRATGKFTSGPLAFNRPITRIARPKQKTTMKLTPIDNPPARPNPHPICLLIPSADEYELQDLTDDIRAHGLIDPIVLFEGMILDGRNRAAACERAGIAPRYVSFEGGREDALILVVSHNLKRRHLTKQAIADALVAAEDFNLHYMLAEPVAAAATDGPEAQSVIKITEPKTAS